MSSNSSNQQQIFVVDTAALSTPATNAASSSSRRRVKNNNSQSFIDALVVLTALPSLTILALLLEANTRGNWLSQPETRYTVFGLGFTLVIICMAIAMYVTSRIGGKMWSGAIPSDGSHPAYSYYNSRMTIDETTDLPPSYEIVMGNGFDIPPPAYHTIVIGSKEFELLTGSTECPKYDAIQHV